MACWWSGGGCTWGLAPAFDLHLRVFTSSAGFFFFLSMRLIQPGLCCGSFVLAWGYFSTVWGVVEGDYSPGKDLSIIP